jgi:hypothetical protein
LCQASGGWLCIFISADFDKSSELMESQSIWLQLKDWAFGKGRELIKAATLASLAASVSADLIVLQQ